MTVKCSSTWPCCVNSQAHAWPACLVKVTVLKHWKENEVDKRKPSWKFHAETRKHNVQSQFGVSIREVTAAPILVPRPSHRPLLHAKTGL